jgi:hypothetical protein
MKDIKTELDGIWLQEETKAWQRSRERDILEGDRNTAYFHAIANQRRGKKTLAVLDGPDGPAKTIVEMLIIASSFYKNLFAKEDGLDISLGPDFWDAQDVLNAEEIAFLELLSPRIRFSMLLNPLMPLVLQTQMVFRSYFINLSGP